eukprot:7280533-Alexandrium_andersonii.AAC.1
MPPWARRSWRGGQHCARHRTYPPASARPSCSCSSNCSCAAGDGPPPRGPAPGHGSQRAPCTYASSVNMFPLLVGLN